MSNENIGIKRKLTEDTESIADKNNMLKPDFFNVSCEVLAKALLGKILARKMENGTVVRGNIVETECYLGGDDKASKSYNGRRTPANEPMFMPPGTAYVYMTYGMYYCFNISSTEPGAAVLLRAIDPIGDTAYMQNTRSKKKRNIKEHELCNGPSKLCISFGIKKDNCNKLDLCDNDLLWVEDDDDIEESQIVTSSRIGIDSAGEEWANKPLRFYILGNKSVSRRDKVVEEIITNRTNE